MDKRIAMIGLETMALEDCKHLLHHIEEGARGIIPEGVPTYMRDEMLAALKAGVKDRINALSQGEFVTIGKLTDGEILKLAECEMREQDLAKAQSLLEMAQARVEMADRELWHMLNDRFGIPYDTCGRHVLVDKEEKTIRAPRKMVDKLGIQIVE